MYLNSSNRSRLFLILILIFNFDLNSQESSSVYSVAKAPTRVQTLSRSVAMIVDLREVGLMGEDRTPGLQFNSDGTSSLNLKPLNIYGKSICEGEELANEVVLGTCTAFLIAPDILVTADHCLAAAKGGVMAASCGEMGIVFNYNDIHIPSQAEGFRVSHPAQDTTTCERIIDRDTDRDIAIIKLKNTSRETPLEMDPEIRQGQFYMLGGNNGTRLRASLGTIDFNNTSNNGKYSASYFGEPGSSGGPVLDAVTGAVIGVNVGGPRKGLYYLDEKRDCYLRQPSDELDPNEIVPIEYVLNLIANSSNNDTPPCQPTPLVIDAKVDDFTGTITEVIDRVKPPKITPIFKDSSL